MDSSGKPPADRNGLEILSDRQCWSLLDATPIGRLAFVHEGEAKVLPVNYAVVDHQIAFRTGRGAKFGVASMERPVSFEVDQWDDIGRTGWSVLIEGMITMVTDEDDEDRLNQIGLHPWAPNSNDPVWVRLRPTNISGRRIPKSRPRPL